MSHAWSADSDKDMFCIDQAIVVRACLTLLLCTAVSLAKADDLGMIDADAVEDRAKQSTESTTIEELEAVAINSHPSIALARAQVDAVRGQYVQAGLPFNPVLQLQADEVGNEDDAGLHTVNISQQFVTANKLDLARQVQAHAIEKQQAQLRLTELRVLTNLRAAYAITLVAQERVRLTDELVELADQSIESVEALYEAEEVSKVSVLQARIEAKKTQIAAEVAETALAAQRRSLAAAAGIQNLNAARLVGAVEQGMVSQPWETLISEIQAASPELAAGGSELERARWALQHACASAVPNVTGQIGLGRDAATDDVFTTVGVSIPLPVRNRNQGNIRAARANVRVAEASIEQTRVSLESRLAVAVGRYETARRRYTSLREKILPDAEETFTLSQEAFEVGESSYLELMAAQRTLIDTRLQVLEAIGQARLAMVEIDGLLVTISQ